jgi:hypothetical protein
MPLNPPACPNPACQKPKRASDYMCRDCWFTLSRAARILLLRRDAKASERLRELYRQLQDGVALHLIQITR